MMGMSKIKDASWFVLIGDEANNQILCVKKVVFKDYLQKTIQVSLPDKFREESRLSVYLCSDCYIGMDQVRYIDLNTKACY